MTTYTVHEAKTNLSKLLAEMEAGGEVIIARGDTPVAILKDYQSIDRAKRRAAAMGSEAGKFAMPPDDVFFGPMSDEEFIELFGQEFFDLHKHLDQVKA